MRISNSLTACDAKGFPNQTWVNCFNTILNPSGNKQVLAEAFPIKTSDGISETLSDVSPLSSSKYNDMDWLRDDNHLFRTASGLGAAESFVDDFFRPRWHFEIGIFVLFGEGRRQGVYQTVERSELADTTALDRLLNAVITRDQDGVGAAHCREVPDGVSFPIPFGEPLFERLAARKHPGKRFRVFSAGHSREMTEKEREIYLLGIE